MYRSSSVRVRHIIGYTTMHRILQSRLSTSHRLTFWRRSFHRDICTKRSSGSSVGNCCHLNGVAGIGCQQCCSMGSLTLSTLIHNFFPFNLTTCAVAHCVSCNITVTINAWDTAPLSDDANGAGSHCSNCCGWSTWDCKKENQT